MSGENAGIFHHWKSLPRDSEWAWKGMQYLIAANVFWFIMFFGLGYFHPLPDGLVAKTGD